MTNLFNRNDGTFAQVDAASVSGNPVLSTITKATTANITVTTTGVFIDGPSVSQGSSGTWYASGSVTVISTGGTNTFWCKLWDGTTVIASGASNQGTINTPVQMSLSGTLASPAGNLRISVAPVFTTGLIAFNQSGNSLDSFITAVRIG